VTLDLYTGASSRPQKTDHAWNDSRGKLGGRQGTFVLQGSEIVENGKIKATWFVVSRAVRSPLRRERSTERQDLGPVLKAVRTALHLLR
jgi:hypothetical protein